MIDVVGAVAAAAAVDTPATVDVADAQDATIARSHSRFQIRDPLAGVLGDLSTTRKANSGETALAVD